MTCVLQMLAGVLERCMKRRGVRDTDPYDWEKAPEAAQSVTTSSSTAAFPSKPQQPRVINTAATSATTENICEDPLAASLGLNNQENLYPGDKVVTGSAQLVDRRTPLQTAQVVLVDKEVADPAANPANPTNGSVQASKGVGAGNGVGGGAKVVANAADMSPKKRRLEEGAPLVAPPLQQQKADEREQQQQQQQKDRPSKKAADLATPDSIVTENSKVDRRQRNDSGLLDLKPHGESITGDNGPVVEFAYQRPTNSPL